MLKAIYVCATLQNQPYRLILLLRGDVDDVGRLDAPGSPSGALLAPRAVRPLCCGLAPETPPWNVGATELPQMEAPTGMAVAWEWRVTASCASLLVSGLVQTPMLDA